MPEINPDAPTPWVLCPECGGTWFRVLVVIEQGRWSEDGERYEASETPRVGAFVTSDTGRALECGECHHKFDLPRSEETPDA